MASPPKWTLYSKLEQEQDPKSSQQQQQEQEQEQEEAFEPASAYSGSN